MAFNFGPKIGIIGLGVVGMAIRRSCQFDTPVMVDPNPNLNCTGTYTDLFSCHGIFVCVPSPSNTDGTCDTSIFESVLAKLDGYSGVIISKVTAPPSVYSRLSKLYPNLVYSPEFLTERNATNDYKTSRFVVLGGTVAAYMNEAKRIVSENLPDVNHYLMCTPEEASLMKYTVNSFLATKVIFMNELKQLADATENVDYKIVTDLLKHDIRIGETHMHVPGPDGQFGFGGMCFPKDTSALLKFAEDAKIELSVLETAVRKNTLLRLG
jgi:UDPglucose 6-dehydrogenase